MSRITFSISRIFADLVFIQYHNIYLRSPLDLGLYTCPRLDGSQHTLQHIKGTESVI